MAKTIKYIGTEQHWEELAYTGKQSVWYPGWMDERSDSEADALLATGKFQRVYTDSLAAISEAVRKKCLRFQNIALFGDSISANQTSFLSAADRRMVEVGSLPWGLAFGGVDHDVVANGGVSGEGTVQMLSRVDAFIAANPTIQAVYLMAGVNDIANAMPSAQVAANIIELSNRFVAAGAYVINGGILPYNAANTARAAQVSVVNSLLYEYWKGRSDGLFVDFQPDFGKSTAASGVGKDNYTLDGTHPKNLGGFYLGKKLGGILAQVMSAYPLVRSAVDYRGINAESNQIFSNPMLLGTSGTAGTNTTGTIPNACNVAGHANVSVVASLLPANSGSGQKLQLVMTATGAGNVTFRTVDSMMARTSAGEYIRPGLRLKVISATALRQVSVQGSGSLVNSYWGLVATSPVDYPSDFELPAVLAPKVLIPAGSTGLDVFAHFGFSGAGSATVEIEQVEMREM